MAVKKTPGEAPKPKKKPPIGQADIKKRAEEIYQERLKKNLPGTEEGDWLEAERQLLAK
jgi:hypothetical protein